MEDFCAFGAKMTSYGLCGYFARGLYKCLEVGHRLYAL